MSGEHWSKRGIRATVRATAPILRAVAVASLVGIALTYFNGKHPIPADSRRNFSDEKLQLTHWTSLLNFLVPFCVELLFSFLGFLRASLASWRATPVLKTQDAMHKLNEIAVKVETEIKKNSNKLEMREIEDPVLRGHHAWPVLSVTPSQRRAAFRTHTNSLCVFDAEELLGWNGDSNDVSLPIRPLPNEIPGRVPRHKSASCLEEVQGTRRIAEIDRLHVFNNGLYSDCITPRELRL